MAGGRVGRRNPGRKGEEIQVASREDGRQGEEVLVVGAL